MIEAVRNEIKELISRKLTTKIEKFSLENLEHKPFVDNLLPSQKRAIGSFVQSVYTTFGMSIYEQIAIIIARGAGYQAERQYALLGDIDMRTEQLIERMWEESKESGCDDKIGQIEQIRESIYQARDPIQRKDSIVDLYVRTNDGMEYYIDIKTVKPNKEAFENFKRKLLRWVGYRLSIDRDAQLGTYIAIPYNPYDPIPYLGGMNFGQCMDSEHDILIQENFWNLLGGDNATYIELLEIFRQVGDELRDRINERLS